MNSGFSEYRSFLTANLRQVAGRKRRKFERDRGAVFNPIVQPEDIASAMDQFLELEAKGWKGRGGTAIHLNPDAEKFYRGIGESFGDHGAIRMGEVRLGDRLVASKLCILHHNRLYTLKEAYDEEYFSFSPSVTLLLAMIEGAYDCGYEALELLGDAEPMKVRFGTSEHRTMIIRSYRPGLTSTPKYLFWDKAVPILKPMNDRRKKRRKALLKEDRTG